MKEKQEIESHKYSQLIFHRIWRQFNGEKSFFNKWCSSSWIVYVGKEKGEEEEKNKEKNLPKSCFV